MCTNIHIAPIQTLNALLLSMLKPSYCFVFLKSISDIKMLSAFKATTKIIINFFFLFFILHKLVRLVTWMVVEVVDVELWRQYEGVDRHIPGRGPSAR